MCGIAGILNFDGSPLDRDRLKRMTDIMEHRGPDDEGQYIKEGVGLGHRRLSIIDLSERGHQPMCNEDGTVWIVFNGEIYNYKSLNSQLAGNGHEIRSNCDTETIIHLYEEYGADCVQHLRGMFSFAIWDENNETLFAAVDRLRIKPFYYANTGRSFVFASELKALITSGLFPRNLNYEAIHHYLSLQAVPVPLTIYENVFTLPGGHCLRIKKGEMEVWQYWDLQFDVGDGASEEYYRKRLAELLWESVELRLMSDVPLGAFLSGGIDSTTIVAIMSEIVKEPVRTFCIGYDVGGSEYDDTYYAGLAAKKFNTTHRELRITAEDIVSSLPGFIYYLDQPSSDAINSYFVSRLAAEDVTVVLCGQGGDELFAGYSSFSLLLKFMARDQKWERLPAPVRALAAASLLGLPASMKKVPVLEKATRFLENYGSFVKKYAQIRMEIPEQLKRGIYSDEFLGKLNGADTMSIYNDYLGRLDNGVDSVNKVSYLDLKTHLGDILMRDVDVMSMAYSLETRVPLIDHVLVEFAATIPGHLKLRDGRAKHIYIESVRDLLPAEIVHRRKLGFNFPLAIWLRKELRPLVDFVLSEEKIAETGLFRCEGVRRLKEEFYSGKVVPYRRVWGLVVLELWLRAVYQGDEAFIAEAASYLPNKAHS